MARRFCLLRICPTSIALQHQFILPESPGLPMLPSDYIFYIISRTYQLFFSNGTVSAH